MVVEPPEADEALDRKLICRISEWRSERHRVAHWVGGGGWGWGPMVLEPEPLCTLAVPTMGLTFSRETSFSPFTLFKKSVAANCLTDSSGGLSKVHTPSIMNEPISCVNQAGVGAD